MELYLLDYPTTARSAPFPGHRSTCARNRGILAAERLYGSDRVAGDAYIRAVGPSWSYGWQRRQKVLRGLSCRQFEPMDTPDHKQARESILGGLREKMPWLVLPDTCATAGDGLDALIASLTARAATQDLLCCHCVKQETQCSFDVLTVDAATGARLGVENPRPAWLHPNNGARIATIQIVPLPLAGRLVLRCPNRHSSQNSTFQFVSLLLYYSPSSSHHSNPKFV